MYPVDKKWHIRPIPYGGRSGMELRFGTGVLASGEVEPRQGNTARVGLKSSCAKLPAFEPLSNGIPFADAACCAFQEETEALSYVRDDRSQGRKTRII